MRIWVVRQAESDGTLGQAAADKDDDGSAGLESGDANLQVEDPKSCDAKVHCHLEQPGSEPRGPARFARRHRPER